MGLVNYRTITKLSDDLAITLSVAKAHCFVDEDDDSQDTYIGNLILTAQSMIEKNLLVPFSFFTKEFEAIYTTAPLGLKKLLLPKEPFKELKSIKFFDGFNWRILDLTHCEIERGDAYTNLLIRMPYALKIQVNFTAGKDSDSDIALELKQAVAMLTGALFEHRIAVNDKNLYENSIYKSITDNLKRF